jgi:tRNA threonylcarbamoyladenosine biosynthesis protein TsaE
MARERAGLMRILDGEAETEALGAALAPVLAGRGALVTLSGELGAGKTTLVRGLLRACGHTGAVRSPTYTLVEPYEVSGRTILHVDLYRLAEAGELEPLGLREASSDDALILVEWPERAAGALPVPDLSLRLEHHAQGRVVYAEATSELGRRCMQVIDSAGNLN